MPYMLSGRTVRVRLDLLRGRSVRPSPGNAGGCKAANYMFCPNNRRAI